MSVDLTEMQRAVLFAFPGGASAEGDNGASWTEVADLADATGLTKKQVMGVLGSLSAKGLVYADEPKANGEKGTLQCLTDEGARLIGMLSDTPEDAAQVVAEVEAEVAGFDQPAAEADAAEGVVDAEPAVEPEAALREKLVLLALDGTVLTSRRVPTAEAEALVVKLVGAFGGGKAHPVEEIAKAGIDAETLKKANKRIRSWFGAGRTAHGKDGFVINLQLRA